MHVNLACSLSRIDAMHACFYLQLLATWPSLGIVTGAGVCKFGMLSLVLMLRMHVFFIGDMAISSGRKLLHRKRSSVSMH